MKKLQLALVLAAILAGSPTRSALAAVVTSIPGGTVVPMPAVNYFGPGPETFGPGITWSSTNASIQGGSVFGFTDGYGFSSNGSWDSFIGPMAGVNDSTDAYGVTDTMTFAFSSPLSAVGGFLNYVPFSSNPTTIAVYDSSHTLIESTTLTFLTGGGTDTGQFLGFQESTANISYFTLTDNYVGIVNLTILGSSVPEPGSVTLLGLGLASVGGIGWLKKRRRKVAAA
jgi:hypothetical protein